MSEAAGQDTPAFRIEAKAERAALGVWYAVTEFWVGEQRIDRVIWNQSPWATSDLAVGFAEALGTVQVQRMTKKIIEKLTDAG